MKIKPFKNLHRQLLLFAIVFLPMPFFDLIMMICFFSTWNWTFLVAILVQVLVLLSIYACCRFFYPYSYIINDDAILKYKRKKRILRIPKDSLKCIIVKKEKWTQIYKVLFQIISTQAVGDAEYLTSAAFLFDDAVIISDRNTSFKFESLKQDLNIEGMEYVDCFTYSDIQRICQLVGASVYVIDI